MIEPARNFLTASIVKVMAEVGTLARSGHNDFSNYDFTTVETVIKTLRPLLIKNGLALVPHNVSITSEQEIGPKMRRVAISATYLLLHESGESITITVPGEGMDSLDKSTAKALTGALKYALLQTFCVDRGEDGDEGKGYEAPRESENAAVRAASTEFPKIPRPHASGGADVVIPFGDYKDKPPSAVPNDQLLSLMNYVERQLKDPSKSKYATKNKALLDGILQEIDRRQRNAVPESGSYEDEVPF